MELSWIITGDPQRAMGEPEPPQALPWALGQGLPWGGRWAQGGVGAWAGFAMGVGATHQAGLSHCHLPHLQEAEAAVNLQVRGAGSAPALVEKGDPRVPPQLPPFPTP